MHTQHYHVQLLPYLVPTNKISIKISIHINIKISINMLSGVLVGHFNQPSFFRSKIEQDSWCGVQFRHFRSGSFFRTNIVHIWNNGGAVVQIRMHETEHKTKLKIRRKILKEVPPAGFEPATFWLGARHSYD